jgi:hypothetical protein
VATEESYEDVVPPCRKAEMPQRLGYCAAGAPPLRMCEGRHPSITIASCDFLCVWPPAAALVALQRLANRC